MPERVPEGSSPRLREKVSLFGPGATRYAGESMRGSPDFLLIDISNSYTKVVPATAGALVGPVRRIATPRLSVAALRRAAGVGRRYRGIILSSVVPRAEKAVEAYAALVEGGAERLRRVDHRAALGIAIDYPNPAGIGADRLANAAGAALFYGAPAVVVDFGTALTFDILAGSPTAPVYCGGVIAPGLEAMTHYLHQRTALLPKIDLSEPMGVIGRSTRDAMLAGAVYGYRGLVRGILAELRRELGAAPHVVATGGYAELIARQLPEIATVHPNLTLEGLRVIAGRTFPAR